MKMSLFFSAIIILSLLTHNVAFGGDHIKVGLIDIQKCFEESKEGQKILELLKKKKAAFQRQLDMKQKELLGLRKRLKKQAMILSMDDQKEKRRTIGRKTRELKYLLRDLNEEMRRVQENERKRMLAASSQALHGHFIYYKALIIMLFFEVLSIEDHGNIFKNI